MQAVEHCLAGSAMLKAGQRGKPHFRQFTLSKGSCLILADRGVRVLLTQCTYERRPYQADVGHAKESGRLGHYAS